MGVLVGVYCTRLMIDNLDFAFGLFAGGLRLRQVLSFVRSFGLFGLHPATDKFLD